MHDIIIDGQSIRDIYTYYKSGQYFVNRKYQRKLVWTVSEKRRLIESITEVFPIPLLLFAERRFAGRVSWEIIDGLQRLDAILSFLNGDFSFDGKYFPASALDSATDTGSVDPKLDSKVAHRLLAYTLPISVFRVGVDDVDKIDEIFRRINVDGHQLSRQEVRQSAALNPYAQLIRKLSAEIRGDATTLDILRLSQVRSISISNDELDYGIQMRAIPWIKSGILVQKDIRQSLDEELVASLVSYIILRGDKDPANHAAPDSNALDSYYDLNSNKGKILLHRLNTYGEDRIERDFLFVYDQLSTTLFHSGYQSFAQWLFNRGGSVQVPKYYQLLFLSLYELVVIERYKILNYKTLSDIFTGFGHSAAEIRGRLPNWTRPKRQESIDQVKKYILGKCSTDVLVRQSGPSITTINLRLERLLAEIRNGYATAYFTSKLLVEDNRSVDVTELCRSICAFSNSGPLTAHYCIIGATISEQDADEYRRMYKAPVKVILDTYVTGIQDEAHSLFPNVRQYTQSIEDAIMNSPIEPISHRQTIVRAQRVYKFKGRYIILIKVNRSSEGPVKYKGDYWSHENSRLIKISELEAWKAFTDTV